MQHPGGVGGKLCIAQDAIAGWLGMCGLMLLDVSPFYQGNEFCCSGCGTDVQQIQSTIKAFAAAQTLVMDDYFMLFEVFAVYEGQMA